MKSFEYYKATSLAEVFSLLAKHQEKAAILAGGSDLLSMMKDRVEGPKFKLPQFLIDINGVKDLSYIRSQKTGLKIGAATTLSEIASSSLIANKYPILAQAAGQVAVPQIRNVGTIGGNLCQRPRCWYFRGGLFKDCLRKGGNNCYTPGGENQYHAVIGGEGCYMVYPSDIAPALTALNAMVEIASSKGSRVVPIEQFYTRPGKNILKENILTHREMLVAVEIPNPAANSKGIYLKLKERQAFDFAIVSVAASLIIKNNTVADSRIVFGGLAPFPLRRTKAEAALKGKSIKDGMEAACIAAVEGAQPLSQNAYKTGAAKGILEEALSRLAS